MRGPQVGVLLADNHDFMRRIMRSLLDREPGVEVLGEATDISAVMREVRDRHPQVLVLAANVPEGSVLTSIRRLRGQAPDTAIVLTTMVDDARLARESLSAGASAYVLADTAGDELPGAIRRAAAATTARDAA